MQWSGCYFWLHRFPTERSLVLTDRFLFPNPALTQLAIMPQSPQVKLLTVAHRNTSQYTLRNHHRRALPPHPSEDGLGPSGLPRPGSSGHLLATDREELVPDPGGTEDSGECTRRSDRALPAARRCLCPSPRNWNSTTAARSWNHVL